MRVRGRGRGVEWLGLGLESLDYGLLRVGGGEQQRLVAWLE